MNLASWSSGDAVDLDALCMLPQKGGLGDASAWGSDRQGKKDGCLSVCEESRIPVLPCNVSRDKGGAPIQNSGMGGVGGADLIPAELRSAGRRGRASAPT